MFENNVDPGFSLDVSPDLSFMAGFGPRQHNSGKGGYGNVGFDGGNIKQSILPMLGMFRGLMGGTQPWDIGNRIPSKGSKAPMIAPQFDAPQLGPPTPIGKQPQSGWGLNPNQSIEYNGGDLGERKNYAINIPEPPKPPTQPQGVNVDPGFNFGGSPDLSFMDLPQFQPVQSPGSGYLRPPQQPQYQPQPMPQLDFQMFQPMNTFLPPWFQQFQPPSWLMNIFGNY